MVYSCSLTKNKLTTLDHIDGGISILLRCPGFKPPPKFAAEDITVDTYISPGELAEGSKEFSEHVAQLIQSFGGEIVLPYLRRFETRCLVEGVKAAGLPGMILFSCCY
jgi:hypothetical protein